MFDSKRLTKKKPGKLYQEDPLVRVLFLAVSIEILAWDRSTREGDSKSNVEIKYCEVVLKKMLNCLISGNFLSPYVDLSHVLFFFRRSCRKDIAKQCRQESTLSIQSCRNIKDFKLLCCAALPLHNSWHKIQRCMLCQLEMLTIIQQDNIARY